MTDADMAESIHHTLVSQNPARSDEVLDDGRPPETGWASAVWLAKATARAATKMRIVMALLP
jgi:hypothetical protein